MARVTVGANGSPRAIAASAARIPASRTGNRRQERSRSKRRRNHAQVLVASGQVELLGRRRESDRRNALGRVGVLIESPSLHEHLSTSENLAIWYATLQLPSQRRRSRVEAVLADVGLAPADNKQVARYLVGMKQRLGLAIALLGEPDLLVLDEPTNGPIRHRRDPRAAAALELTIIATSTRSVRVESVVVPLGVGFLAWITALAVLVFASRTPTQRLKRAAPAIPGSLEAFCKSVRERIGDRHEMTFGTIDIVFRYGQYRFTISTEVAS